MWIGNKIIHVKCYALCLAHSEYVVIISQKHIINYFNRWVKRLQVLIQGTWLTIRIPPVRCWQSYILLVRLTEDLGQLVLQSNESFWHVIVGQFWILLFPGGNVPGPLIFLPLNPTPTRLEEWTFLFASGQHSSPIWFSGHIPVADLPTSRHTLYLPPSGPGRTIWKISCPWDISWLSPCPHSLLLNAPLVDINGSTAFHSLDNPLGRILVHGRGPWPGMQEGGSWSSIQRYGQALRPWRHPWKYQ